MAKSQKKHATPKSKRKDGRVSKAEIRAKAKAALLKRAAGEFHNRRAISKSRSQLGSSESGLISEIDTMLKRQRHYGAPGMDPARPEAGHSAAWHLDHRRVQERRRRLVEQIRGEGFDVRQVHPRKDRFICTYGGQMIHKKPERFCLIKYALKKLGLRS